MTCQLRADSTHLINMPVWYAVSNQVDDDGGPCSSNCQFLPVIPVNDHTTRGCWQPVPGAQTQGNIQLPHALLDLPALISKDSRARVGDSRGLPLSDSRILRPGRTSHHAG